MDTQTFLILNKVQKNPEWLRQFYGHLEKLRSLCRKTSMPIKFLVFGGGGYLGFKGGGRADFNFMGAGILLKSRRQGDARGASA